MRRALFLLLIAVTGCSGDGGGSKKSLPPTDPAELAATLEDLAAFGEKRAGTAGGQAAALYVSQRLEALGLDVTTDSFTFPQTVITTAALAFTIDGAPFAAAYEVLEAGGSATLIDAPVVHGDTAEPEDLAGAAGAVVLVDRAVVPHRSAQYANVTSAGGLAFVHLSTAPDNLPQIGSVRFGWETAGTIPALVVGSADAATLRSAATGGAAVTATMNVVTGAISGTGTNVLGRLAGDEPGVIVIGAHYDTWFAGSVDNGGGVAAMIALADRLVRRGTPRHDLLFVGFDGEELGLYGGYHLLRRLQESGEPVLAVINLEVPAAIQPDISALAYSAEPPLDEALDGASLDALYDYYTDLSVVPALFGGVIPTDIQGIYRANLPTVTTAVSSPWYHTTADTPDKVDLPFLATAVDRFDDAIRELLRADPASLQTNDPNLWLCSATVLPRNPGEPLVADVLVTDDTGSPRAGVTVSATLLHDDFFQSGLANATTDASGAATIDFPAAQADLGTGRRFLHITSGADWPLVERVVPTTP